MFFTKRTQFILYFPALFWVRLKFNHESLPCLEPKPCPEPGQMGARGSLRAIFGTFPLPKPRRTAQMATAEQASPLKIRRRPRQTDRFLKLRNPYNLRIPVFR